MRRDVWKVPAPGLSGDGTVVAYGHWGIPVLFFPAEGGSAFDIENNRLIHELAGPIEAGGLKVYAVDSNDHRSWSHHGISIEERAHAHGGYEDWIVRHVAPAIHADCGGQVGIATAGMSLGAYHAVNAALRRADVFPHTLGMSGNYDPTMWRAWGEPGDAVYFHNPMAYLRHMHGDHLDRLRGTVFVQLCVGTGAWEVDPTGALPSTLALAGLLAEKGIPHDLDIWGEDTPHDWPSWRRMVAKHLVALADLGSLG